MKDERSVAGGALIILLAGIALGVAHNVIGLASRPPRGIAWKATETRLPKLASLAPDSVAAHAEPIPGDTPAVEPGTAAGGSGPSTQAPAASTVPAAGSSSPARAAAADPSPTAAGIEPGAVAGADPGRAASVPSVPDLDQPVEVDLATVKRLFDLRAALFLDARDPPEYETGHIPGAVRLTRNDVLAEPERLAGLPVRGRPIVAYCEGGACEASLDLAKTLVESGFRKVLVFTGGMPEWAAAGHPVERGGTP